MQEKIANFQSSLRKKGYKMTLQRMAIYEALHLGQKHPTAEEVYEQVCLKFPVIGLSTVYNTLETLYELGLVDKLNFDSAGARYDVGSKPHAHIICLGCGQISDNDHLQCDRCKERMEQESGFRLLKQSATFYGYCRQCLKEKPELNI